VSRAQILTLHASAAAATVSGAVFAWMKYFMKSDDPFAVANHPWQPYMLSLHVVAAPVLLFALGWIFQGHILGKLAGNGGRPRRATGIAAMTLIAPMVLSAYLMQVFTGEGLHRAMTVTHWISSGLFVFAYGGHLAVRKNGV